MKIDVYFEAIHRAARAQRAEAVYRFLVRPVVELLSRAAE